MRRAGQRKFHYVYKTTRVDGRYYIGMHSTDVLEDGYLGSGKKISRSIKKHGTEKHSKEILEFFPTRDGAKVREIELITDELRLDPMCMNIAPGGGGGFINEDHAQKLFKAARIGGLKTGPTNIKATHTAEVRKKIVEARKAAGNYQSYMTGKTHSEKTKQQMAISQTGSKNSQFGKCWVMKDGISKSIPKELLEEHLKQGFVRGRKC